MLSNIYEVYKYFISQNSLYLIPYKITRYKNASLQWVGEKEIGAVPSVCGNAKIKF